MILVMYLNNIYIYIYIYIITLPGINDITERDAEISRLLLMMTLKEFTNIKSGQLRYC